MTTTQSTEAQREHDRRWYRSDRYWWHQSIARELARLRDECDKPAYNVKGIAGNVRMLEMDVRKHLEEMAAWGEIVKAEPLWDYAPTDWYALA